MPTHTTHVIAPKPGQDVKTLDELLEPVAASIGDPRHSNHDVHAILERLVYLRTRGLARDGRTQLLLSLSFNALSLYTEQLRHDGRMDPLMEIVERALTLYITDEDQADRRRELMKENAFTATSLYAAELRRSTDDKVPDLTLIAQGLGISDETARLIYALTADELSPATS